MRLGWRWKLSRSEGEPEVAEIEDYTSHNTDQLDLEGVVDLLLTLPEIRAEMGAA